MATLNFTDTELSCRCGCGRLPPYAFQRRLQELRELYDRPMFLSSCARCEAHNIAIGSTSQAHLYGAADVLIFGQDAWDLLHIALHEGWSGIGIKQHGPMERRFVHLDRLLNIPGHPRPYIWSYTE